MVSIGSKLIRELKRPFTQGRRLKRAVELLRFELEAPRAELACVRSELACVRSELASVRSELEFFESRVRAEFLAQARSLEVYRDLADAARQAQRPPE